jgi:hypothetical protein
LCSLTASDSKDVEILTVSINYSGDPKAAYEQRLAEGAGYQPISGVGDRAAFAGRFGHNLVVATGSAFYSIELAANSLPPGQGQDQVTRIYALIAG